MAWGGGRKVGKCRMCGAGYTWCDKQGKFCSNRCRQKAYRDRNKVAPEANALQSSIDRSLKTGRETLQRLET